MTTIQTDVRVTLRDSVEATLEDMDGFFDTARAAMSGIGRLYVYPDRKAVKIKLFESFSEDGRVEYATSFKKVLTVYAKERLAGALWDSSTDGIEYCDESDAHTIIQKALFGEVVYG